MRLYYLLVLIIVIPFTSVELSGQCDIRDLEVERLPCTEEDLFSVVVNFVHQNTGNEGFRIQGNGVNYGEFEYAALPITIDGLEGNCDTEYEFVVRDIEMPECAADINFGKVCCNIPCAIEIFDLEVSECVNGGYNVSFDIERENTTDLGADVFINGEFVEFVNYNDFPVFFEDVAALNDRDNEVIVCDSDNPSCCDTLLFESPCICSLKDVNYRIESCSDVDSNYYFTVDFNTNMVGDSFRIGGNGNFFGNYAYADLPVTIGPAPFHQDTAFYLMVDERNAFCFEEVIIPPIDTCDFDCVFSNIVLERTECEEGTFFAHITFDVKNPGLSGFTIRGNGVVYGEDYEYGESTYIIGPLEGDCTTQYEFILIDNDVDGCSGEVFFDEPVCCLECDIKELEAELICEGDVLVGVQIENYQIEYSKDSTFYVNVNGEDFGPYHYNDLPIILNYENTNVEEVRIEVIDGNDEGCTAVAEILVECKKECGAYVNIFTENGECLDDGKYFVDIEFELEGSHSDSFYIAAQDQIFGPFVHGETSYSFGPLEASCENEEIKIFDGEDDGCFQEYLIEDKQCCVECEIELVTLEVECEDFEMVGINIKVENANASANGYYVKIGNDVFDGLSYNETEFIEISLAAGEYTIVIIDSENEDCAFETTLVVNCGDVNPCSLFEINVETVNCNVETFMFLIRLEHNRPDNELFDLYINNVLQGTLSYSLLPYTTGELNRNDGGPWHILIKDKELEECAVDIELEEELCESNTIDQNLEDVSVRTVNGDVVLSGLPHNETFVVSVFDIMGRTLVEPMDSSNQSEFTLAIDRPMMTQIILVNIKSEIGQKTFRLVR